MRFVTCVVLLWAFWPAYGQCVYDGAKHEEEGAPHEPDPPGTQFAGSGVTMLSRVMVADLPGANASANDVWGYVSPSGREYALLGLRGGTAFIEVTAPTAPVVVDYYSHPAGCCSDIKVYQDYAYIVTEGGGGMQVFDLSPIDAGTVTLVTTFAANALTQAHNLAINEESGFAYICGAQNNPSNGGLFIVDIRVPTMPVYAGSWSDVYVHDVQVVTYHEGLYAGREIAFAFCGSANLGLRIIDVTSKSSPTTIGALDYPRQQYTHQGWLSEDRRCLYIDDEFDETYYGLPTSTFVIDVSKLESPRYLRSFSTGKPSIDHNLYVKGDFIFEANYTSGMRIFYAPVPGYIQEVGYFDTHAEDDLPLFHGAWTAYPFLPSGTVLVSDIENGLFVLDVSEALSRAAPLVGVDGWAMEVVLVLTIVGLSLAAARRLIRNG